jgi:hypothetical protein
VSALTASPPGGTALPAGRRVVVCGSRKFSDPLKATATICQRIVELPADVVLVHGDAAGADRLAGTAAERVGLTVVKFPADWETHSDDCRCQGYGWCREAGKRRNLQMLDLVPYLVIAFWNGSSTGTLHTISNARERGLPLEVIRL